MRALAALAKGLLLLLVAVPLLSWVMVHHPSFLFTGCILLVCAAAFAVTRPNRVEAATAPAKPEDRHAEMRDVPARKAAK